MVGLPCLERRALAVDDAHAALVAFYALFEKVGQAVLGVLHGIAVQVQFRADGELAPAQFPEQLVLNARRLVQEFLPRFPPPQCRKSLQPSP